MLDHLRNVIVEMFLDELIDLWVFLEKIRRVGC